MRKQLLILLFMTISLFAKAQSGATQSDATQSDANSRLYELRTYYSPEGKLENLQNRFRQHSIKLLTKHGMKVEGFWVPLDNKENKLVYLMSYPSREAREKSWKDFFVDKEWIKVKAESEKDGPIAGKVENVFLKTTDFSPNNMKSMGNRVFELRTYKATPDHLPNLLSRFRDHTVKLFENNGMTNIMYWTPTDKDQGSDDMLIYFLAHKTKEDGLASFKTFGGSPECKPSEKHPKKKREVH